MKRGYKKLLLFEFFVLILVLLNSFLFKFLSQFTIILFFIGLLFLFKFIFGFEKDKHRYTKNVIIEIFIILLMFFIIFYLFGLIVGFVKNNSYLNFYGLSNIIIPIFITIILKEVLRYEILMKASDNKLLIILSCILFIIFDLFNSFSLNDFSSKYNIFLFISLNLIPTISNNIVCTYLSIKSGYKPLIFYQIIIQLYSYILPIIPDVSEYIVSLIGLLLPIIIGRKIYNDFRVENDEYIVRNYKKKDYLILGFSSFIVIFLVYFCSGYFKYHVIAIASGSMHPYLNKGDLVVVEKINKDTKLKKGMIIAYKYYGVTIIHRINRVVKINNEDIFYTKGDSNNEEDKYKVKKSMISGIVKGNIDYVGWPIVWLNEL
ncbi:MAG: signal peptidase I [Bacilli bacterium]|nr:signal peptidase I [Bacilli bacterium]